MKVKEREVRKFLEDLGKSLNWGKFTHFIVIESIDKGYESSGLCFEP